MGLRPTHRDESALLTARLIPNGLCNDFRRSVMGMLRQTSRSLGEEPSQPEDCARCDRNSEESEYHLQTEKTSCRIASDLDEVQEGASVFDAF